MRLSRSLGSAAVFSMAMVVAVSASATTLIRQGLEDLVANDRTIVIGEVVDTHSYWNAEGTFILTDVRVAVQELLKGESQIPELTLTIMGGSVGDLTTLIVGGAELVPGRAYLLFLDQLDLPGAKGVRTVRYHSQGVFEIENTDDGPRAISQASRMDLVPDKRGLREAPGGRDGIPLRQVKQTIRGLINPAEHPRREVK